MAKHTVLKPVLHGEGKGKPKLYRKNEGIELTDEQAAPLIAAGHVAAPAKKETR